MLQLIFVARREAYYTARLSHSLTLIAPSTHVASRRHAVVLVLARARAFALTLILPPAFSSRYSRLPSRPHSSVRASSVGGGVGVSD